MFESYFCFWHVKTHVSVFDLSGCFLLVRHKFNVITACLVKLFHSCSGHSLSVLSVWGQEIRKVFIFYATSGVQLKGVAKSSVLSKNEPLTRNIDEDMAV